MFFQIWDTKMSFIISFNHNFDKMQTQLQKIKNVGLFENQTFYVGLYLNGVKSIVIFVFELGKNSTHLSKTDFKDGCLVAILYFGSCPFSNWT